MTEKTNNIKKIAEIIIRIAVVLISLCMIYWYAISGYIAFGNVVGIMIFAAIGIIAAFFTPIKELLGKIRKKKAGKMITNILLVMIVLFCIYCAAAIGLMLYGANNPPEEGATLVVLGCQVRGKEPSHTLRLRLEAACRYLNENPRAKAVLSGGKGDHEEISEAQCMYNYLTEKGISPDRLYIEDKSTTTNENIRFSEEIIKKNGLDPRLAIATDWYHEFRAGLICRRQGYSCGAVSADTAGYLTAHLVTREIFAIANEVIFKH